MKIKELKINNFKSFRGETTFYLETNEEQNIVLIGGENGSGKTSIFEAIKICIYGPLAYRYQGMVPNYIARIKSIINEDAFANANIKSYVQLVFKMNVDGKEEIYTIKREWTLFGGRLFEEFRIMQSDILLDGLNKEKFETYLQSIIPPDVFDLFFFDGERLSDFFENKSFETKLKDIILTLNNLDIFNTLGRELRLNIRRKNRERFSIREQVFELEKLEEKLIFLQGRKKNILSKLESCNALREELNVEIENTNTEFIKAGGLHKKERENLLNKISIAENKRESLNQEIREFSNDILPFIIVKDLLVNIKEQIYTEEDYGIYKIIKERLNKSKIAEIINKTIDCSNALPLDFEIIVSDIIREVVPIEYDNNFKPIHYLSKEQQGRVISIIDSVLKLDVKDINYFAGISDLTSKIAVYKKRLSNALIDEEQQNYINNLSRLNENLNDINIKLANFENEILEVDDEISKLVSEINRFNEKINILRRTDNIRDISTNLISMIEGLLTSVTLHKKREIEAEFNTIFSQIIRKEKLIDFIKLEEDFKISLYARKTFTISEIKKLIVNLGMAGIENKFGAQFIEKIFQYCSSDNKRDILVELNKKSGTDRLELDTRIDVMNLSSGEKQVYILCLYWAIIKSSGISIPFIIDTPYGRIDEEHRKIITRNFFPKVSHQVIILSTNTEIEEGLYEDISKYVFREYTLDYDTKNRETKVKEGYFYEVV